MRHIGKRAWPLLRFPRTPRAGLVPCCKYRTIDPRRVVSMPTITTIDPQGDLPYKMIPRGRVVPWS